MPGPIRLSVCITTRNREAYIAETLESILSQCPPEVEVVVVDGASTDGTVGGGPRRGQPLPAAAAADARRRTPGLDADFDKAVQAAQRAVLLAVLGRRSAGAGGDPKVLQALPATSPTVVIVDASVHDADFERALQRPPPAGTATRADTPAQDGGRCSATAPRT